MTKHKVRMPIIKKKNLQTINARRVWRKKNRLALLHTWVCKLMQPLWKQFLKKQKLELLYDPAIPLLGIYPEKTIFQKDTCTLVFISVLFTIARTWKQPKCPSTGEWIKKMWYIYTMDCYSTINRNKIASFVVMLVDLSLSYRVK